MSHTQGVQASRPYTEIAIPCWTLMHHTAGCFATPHESPQNIAQDQELWSEQ